MAKARTRDQIKHPTDARQGEPVRGLPTVLAVSTLAAALAVGTIYALFAF